MSLMNDIQAQIKEAMKSGDARRRDALRLVYNALKNEYIEKREDLTPDEEIAILTRESKKRREAMDAYRQAGSDDRADQEAFEFGIIGAFLPAAMTEEDVRKLIDELVSELQITSKKDLPKLMKSLMPRIKGRFDGKEAKRLVDALEVE